MPAVAPVDSNGAAIVVGAQVKLRGTVLAINSFSNRYQEITVGLTNPVAGVPTMSNTPSVESVGGSPGAVLVIQLPPTCLTLGV
jgi:hypothetical protein